MRIFYLTFFLALLCSLSAIAQPVPPTTPASNITYNSLDGGSFRIVWTSGNGARRVVVMRQGTAVTALPVNGVDYNPSPIFGSGDAISAGQFVVYDNTSSFVDVSGFQPATTYHIAIFEYNGTASTTQYLTASFAASSQSTLSPPTIASSAITAPTISGSTMTLNWTNGNGARRLVLVKQGSAVNANPSDLSIYNANTVYGSGTQVGTGNYSILNNTASTVTITGLQPATTYHYSIFDYNGSSGPVYLIPGSTANFTTAPRPTVAASGVSFSSIEGATMRMLWTSGNGARRIVVARAGAAVTAIPTDGIDYTANAAFGSGDDLGSSQFVVYDGTSSFIDLTGLSPATTYHFRVYEYDGTGTSTSYLTAGFGSGSQATLSSPTVPVSNLNFTNLSGSGVTVNWTNGNGSRRLLLVRAGSAVNADPVNLTFYAANSNFGSGTQVGTGNYVLGNTASATVSITGLAINTTYHFAVYEFNGVGTPMYLVPGTTGSITTPATPTIAASGLSFTSIEGNGYRVNWTNGNGQRRIVVVRAGAAVTATPVDGIDYTHNTQFGLGDDLGSNQYVLYDGTSTFFDISALQPSTTYHFRVYEYNGTGATTSYLTASFGSGNQATLSAPVTPTSAINFTNVSGSTVRINWTNGSGTGRLLLMHQGAAVDSDPPNLSFYNGNSIFGSGTEIGTGNFVIYRSTANNITVTNLLPATTYHIAAYEYNGSVGPMYRVPGVTASITTAAQPTVAASAISFSQVEGNSMRVLWTSGNGARRIVVARAGSAVTALPANGTDYTPSGVMGSGDNLGSGQFVVYDGVSSFVDISNLSPNITYHFAVFEYDGTGTGTAYQTSTFASASQASASTPTIQSSNLIFSNVGGTTLTASWTLGNGQSRIVVVKQGSPVDADPSDLSFYTAGTAFGTGTQIGTGNYVVYRSTGSTVNITNLLAGTTYYFAIYEYNGVSIPVYMRPGLTGSVTTVGPPTVQATTASAGSITATSLQLNWVNGSGNRRMVLMKAGSAVDANPVDNGAYTANSGFGSGTVIGTGNYVVYSGTGNSILVTGLSPSTTYHFAVFEFNLISANSQFLITNPARNSATTNALVPVRFVNFTAIKTATGIQLNWSTAQEDNSASFQIERSADGRVFESIGSVQAAGFSSMLRNYMFKDFAPLKGNAFYRIRQIDLDGKFMFSKVVAINSKLSGMVLRYTNPIKDQLLIELTNTNPSVRTEWKLYDLAGRLMMKGITTGNTIKSSLPVSLVHGVYVLEILQGEKRELLKLEKQ